MFKFITDLWNDPRLPKRDRIKIILLLVLIISPVDLIPDWTPIFGQLDDLLMIGLVSNYFAEVLDDDVPLSHYPWTLKSFRFWKRILTWLGYLAPGPLKKRLWAYQGSPYRRN